MEINWNYYLGLPTWTEHQGICLLFSIDPNNILEKGRFENPFITKGTLSRQNLKMASDDAHKLVLKIDELTNIAKVELRNVTISPAIFINWAIEKNYDVPIELINFVKPGSTSLKDRELKQGLRDIWIKESRPEMKAFFPTLLKKYVKQKGSPVDEVYISGNDAGIKYRLSTGTTGK